MVLPAVTPVKAAIAACTDAGVGAAVVLGDDPGDLIAALVAAGLRAVSYSGDSTDSELAEMVAELFGDDAELILRQ
jgi:hypothetical protein